MKEEIFEEVKTYLQEHDNYFPSDDVLISIYADAVTNWHSLTADIEEEGHQVQDRDKLPRKNPKLMAQRHYSEQVQKVALLLGITPYGRKKSGMKKPRLAKMTKAGSLRPLKRNQKTK